MTKREEKGSFLWNQRLPVNALTPGEQADLREAAVGLVEDLDDHVHLVHLSVVPQLLPHATEDLGERPLAQAVVLKRICSYFEKLLFTGSGLSFLRTDETLSLSDANRKSAETTPSAVFL